MTCVRAGNALVMMGGPDLKITSGGKTFYFEFHPFCGPMMLSKRGEPIQSTPGKYSPFWDALYFWIKQGKKVDADGNCIFVHETALVNIVKQIGPRSFIELHPPRANQP